MKNHYAYLFSIILMLFITSITMSVSAQVNGPGTNQEFSIHFAEPELFQAPLPQDKIPATDGSLAYGNNVWTSELFSFDTDTPATVNVVGTMTTLTTSGDFHPDENGYMYVMDINTNYLGKIDIATGETVDSVFVAVPLTDGIWTVLTIHKTTGEFYGIATNGVESTVYSINPVIGSTALAIETGLTAVISGTFDGDGLLWMFEISADDIYKLNLDDMDIEFVGGAGFNGNFAQGMGYDPLSDNIYMAAYEDPVGPQLRMLNRLTGEATMIEDLPGETTAFGFPGESAVPVMNFMTIYDLYNDPGIQDGDEVTIIGSYTNPETNILVDNYGDIFIDEAYPPQSYVKTRGITPSENAWNGGFLVVTGTVYFEDNPDAFHPEDSEIALLYISAVQVLIGGDGPDKAEVDATRYGKEPMYSGTRDCDSCKFAVLISGGIDTANNHSKYWENLVALYNFKVDSMGYCKDNVFVHYFKGDRRDNRIPQDRVSKADSAGIAASHTEISKRVAKCTKEGKESTFQKMVSNHGSSDGTINLLGSNTLDPENLKDMQQKIVDSCATTIYDEFVQCYGGYSVSEIGTMDGQNKAKIYANSNADSVKGFSPHNQVHSYLKAKIEALDEGKSYEEAVVAAKMAYDDYLPDAIAWYHARLQELRAEDTSDYADPAYAHQYFQNKIQKYLADSTTAANSICNSRNVSITSFTEYCEWDQFVVPPGGQLVLNFEGTPDNCGNVTVYKEDPVTGVFEKVKEWNWNVEGSYGYQEGNKQRVINGADDEPCTFWIHNDNNGDALTIRASSNGNQKLEESPTNETAYAGFSFGGDDGNAFEFGFHTTPQYFVEAVDQVPLYLFELPGYFGPEYVQGFGCSFNISPSDPYWTDMSLHLDVAEVIQPGDLIILFEGIGNTFFVPINEPGEYNIHIGDMSFLGGGLMQILADNVSFCVDSWGLRSLYGQEQPFEQLLELELGWSGISSFVEPVDPFLPVIINPVIDQFTLLQNDQGNLFWPDQGINTLQIWDPSQGYVINMQQAATLPVQGMPIEFPAVFIDEGWNYVPVLISQAYPPEALFGGLTGFVMAKEIAGPGVFWPEFNINTIGNLMPGNAYNAFSLQPGETYYEVLPFDKSEPVEQNSAAEFDSPWNPVNYTPNSHTVIFNLKQDVLQPDDIIGAFTGNNWCAGEVFVHDPLQNQAMAANATDPSKEEITGLVADEKLTYKLYRTATNEIFDLEPVYDPELNTGYFTENGLSVITDLKLSPTGVTSLISADLKIYPNPGHGYFTIESDIEKMELSVYNAFGEIVFQETAAGNTKLNLTDQPKGTYFVKIESAHGSWFEKIVIY